MEILDIDNGFYMAKFNNFEDRERALNEGPWLLFDHYVAVHQWSSDFFSFSATIDRTNMWVRFPSLNLVFYDESVLLSLASTIGKPIKVVMNTVNVECGKFARVCVEIDLSVPVVVKIWIMGHWQCVEYEGLHIICSGCGRYGHLKPKCTYPMQPDMLNLDSFIDRVSQDQVQGDPRLPPIFVHGEWLTVQCRSRPLKVSKVVTPSSMIQKNNFPRPKKDIGSNSQLPLKERADHFATAYGKKVSSKDKEAISTLMKLDLEGPRQLLKKKRRFRSNTGNTPIGVGTSFNGSTSRAFTPGIPFHSDKFEVLETSKEPSDTCSILVILEMLLKQWMKPYIMHALWIIIDLVWLDFLHSPNFFYG